MGAGGEDDEGRDGHGEEEDQEEEAVDYEADLLPLQLVLLPRLRLVCTNLVSVNSSRNFLQHPKEPRLNIFNWKYIQRIEERFAPSLFALVKCSHTTWLSMDKNLEARRLKKIVTV